MDYAETDRTMLTVLGRVQGIERVRVLHSDDREAILDEEARAEAQSLMGLGKVVNAGVRQVLASDRIYVALTKPDFDWGGQATLVLKKGPEIVGEEVHDAGRIRELSQKPNVWFLHKNFVIYKDRIAFPNDIMKKICHFEIPCLPAELCVLDQDQLHCHVIGCAAPSVPADLFLKQQYFDGHDEKGLGTILIGVNLQAAGHAEW